MKTFMPNDLTRRGFVSSVAAAGLFMASPAQALSTEQAKALIDKVVARIYQVINTGKPLSAMIPEFEKLFADFADVTYIAATTLGPPWRSASNAQKSAYVKAFQGYMARKYGKRFREFIGGKIVVKGARQVKSHYEVDTTTVLQGRAPFNVVYLVSDKSGRDVFYDMLIEGVSLRNSEKEEMGALYDKSGRDLNTFIANLKNFG